MKKNIVRFMILFISIAFIAIGVFREEHILVLQKAVAICLECIGVG